MTPPSSVPLRTCRNTDGLFSWPHFHHALFQAANHAATEGLLVDQRILEKTMWRGICIARRFGDIVALAIFTDKLPNSRGVSKSTLDDDQKTSRTIQKALGLSGGPQLKPAAAAGGGSSLQVGGGFSSPPSLGAAAGLAPQGFSSGVAQSVAALQYPSVTLPLGGGVARKSKAKAVGPRGGGGARASLPSNRGLSKIDVFNGALQDAQQHLHPVAGGPTCEKCKAAGRNANHNHKTCAFSICSKCRRAGHRSNGCPY